jgi:hypothetical protein
MANPFLRSIAGVFSTIVDSSGKATVPQRICAALARVISAEQAKALDPDWWTYAVNQVPHLTLSATVNGFVDGTDAALLPGVCFGSPIIASAPQAKRALTLWIATIPEPATLNSLAIVQGQQGELNLSLTFIGDGQARAPREIPFRRTD